MSSAAGRNQVLTIGSGLEANEEFLRLLKSPRWRRFRSPPSTLFSDHRYVNGKCELDMLRTGGEGFGVALIEEPQLIYLPLWRETFTWIEYLKLRASHVYRGVGVPRGDQSPVVVVPGFLAHDIYLFEDASVAPAHRLPPFPVENRDQR